MAKESLEERAQRRAFAKTPSLYVIKLATESAAVSLAGYIGGGSPYLGLVYGTARVVFDAFDSIDRDGRIYEHFHKRQ
jgi:hypothetical protein